MYQAFLFLSVFFACYWAYWKLIYPLTLSALAKIPGPRLNAVSHLPIAYQNLRGNRTLAIHGLFSKYGNVVRISPDEVIFDSLDAVKVLYGAGTKFDKSGGFYDIYVIDGQRPMFTMWDNASHSERKRMYSNIYAKSSVLAGPSAQMLRQRVANFIQAVQSDSFLDGKSDVFRLTHYLSLDVVSAYVFGEDGATDALRNLKSGGDRSLVEDHIKMSRTLVTWMSYYFPITVDAVLDINILRRLAVTLKIVRQGDLPMEALNRYAREQVDRCVKGDCKELKRQTVIGKLVAQKESSAKLTTDDIAVDAADHFGAGSTTTADTLTYIFFELSKPQNLWMQRNLHEELQTCEFDSLGALLDLRSLDRSTFLNGIILEGLRLHAPIPMTQERRNPARDEVICDYFIPGGTRCAVQPYSMQRDPVVFKSPDKFDPTRWLIDNCCEEYKTMHKHMLAFGAGSRICIGMHLAMTEMALLIACVYHQFTTSLPKETTEESMEMDDSVGSASPKSRRCNIVFQCRSSPTPR